MPDTWELDFENGLPNASRGRLVTDGLPPGSKGAAAAARFDRGEDGIFFEVSAPKIWDGLFAIQSDSHLHFTYKMQRADWVNVFVITRSSGERGRHSGNYLFNEPIYPRQPGKWYTVTIPMNKLFRAGSGKGPPPSVRDIPFMVLFSSLGDRGLVIDRIWVTRGGPGSVEIRGIE